MERLRHELTSIDWWTRTFSVLAIPGMVALLIGSGSHNRPLVLAGALLSAPLMAGGALAFLAAVSNPFRARPGRP